MRFNERHAFGAAAALVLFALAACQPDAGPKSGAPQAKPAAVGPTEAAEGPTIEVPAGNYVLDKTHASITFRVDHMGLSKYTARFTRFDIGLKLDPANPTTSVVTANVDPTSIETDYAGEKNFDQELGTGENFFNAAKFATVNFVSRELTMTGPRAATMRGDMTMLGVTRPVAFDVTFNGSMASHPFARVPAVGFSAVGKIKRSDFGMNYLVGQGVGDEVDILIEAEFLHAPAAAPAAQPAIPAPNNVPAPASTTPVMPTEP
jgi:polyisoprenoid-binding protein YceI